MRQTLERASEALEIGRFPEADRLLREALRTAPLPIAQLITTALAEMAETNFTSAEVHVLDAIRLCQDSPIEVLKTYRLVTYVEYNAPSPRWFSNCVTTMTPMQWLLDTKVGDGDKQVPVVFIGSIEITEEEAKAYG